MKTKKITPETDNYGRYDVFHNWLAGSKPYARRVVTDVIARNEKEAKLLYQAHVDRSKLVDEASSTRSIDEHAMFNEPATSEQYEEFLFDTLRSEPSLRAKYPAVDIGDKQDA
jgi:hypothetical protein